MRKTLFWFHVVALVLLSGYLRVWGVMNESPGYEEMAASLIAMAPISDYLASAQPDFCPPVFYAVLNAAAQYSSSLGMLRLVSILAGGLVPLLIYVGGRKLYGEAATVLAAYLLAVNPLHIYYSQEVQPSALLTLAAMGAFFFMVRVAETNRLRDWAIYDALAIAILHLQREAPFLLAAFLLIQLCRAAFFPPTDEQRRIRRSRLLQAILLNHLIIVSVSLAWLWTMPNKVPWPVASPTARDLSDVFSNYYVFGMTGWKPWASWITGTVMTVLLLPPAVKLILRMEFRTFAVVASLFLGLAIPFVYSLIETPRFVAAREGMTTIPFFCLGLGILLARCNPYIRFALLAVFGGVFLASTVAQARSIQKTASTDMLEAIVKDKTGPPDVVAFWPEYTTTIGRYWNRFYGRQFNSTSAGDLLQTWADLPADQTVYFVISHFPSKSAHLYTFQGALTQYSDSAVLWQNGLNSVIKATNLNRKILEPWYDEPRTLKILDQPAPRTQFMFTAADKLFDDSQFHHDRLDISYEPTGHRYVWTAARQVRLELPVMLAPGYYTLKLHCAPSFEQAGENRFIKRTVNVELRTGEDRKKMRLENPATIALNFSTDMELAKLPVTISVDDLLTFKDHAPGSYGLKIYSISIDEADVPVSG